MTPRVGFLGAGFIANLHAFQLQQCQTPNRIVAVHDLDRERSSAFSEWTGAAVCSSADEVVENSDVVFICTWTSEHPALLDMTIEAGRAVFVEKPLGVDLATARTMAQSVEAAGIRNAVGLVLRSSPALLALRHLVNHQDASRLMNIIFRDDQYLPVQGVYNSKWRADPQRAGSGVLLEHSIHDLDILEWLAGPISSISAQVSYFHDLPGIEDSVSLVARFPGGHTATLASVWHNVLSRPSQRRMEVFNECAYTSLEGDLVGPIHWTCQTSDHEDITEGVLDGSTIEGWLEERGIEVISAEERFIRSVVQDSHYDGPTVADALRAHVLVDAAYRSTADGGIPVDVPADPH